MESDLEKCITRCITRCKTKKPIVGTKMCNQTCQVKANSKTYYSKMCMKQMMERCTNYGKNPISLDCYHWATERCSTFDF